MVYLLNTKFSSSKLIVYSLSEVFGINMSNSQLICKRLGIAKNCIFKNLPDRKIKNFAKSTKISNILVTNHLKKHNDFFFKNLVNSKSCRGLRIFWGLPVRGQRTHTNAKTALKSGKFLKK